MNTTLYIKRFENTASADVTEDISIPDYLPEVRRIVGVHASVTVDGKYLTGEELEADGNVVYTVLYTAADGSLAQLSESTAYTGRVPLKSEDDRFGSEDIVLSAAAENVNCRVTAPRRITLSSRVKMCAVSEKAVDGSLHVASSSPEVSVRRKVSSVHTGYLTEMRQNGEAQGEIREREGMKLVCASGNIGVGDVRMIQSSGGKKVSVKGEVSVNLLLLSPEGMYVQSKGRVPFEEEIPLGEKNGQGTDVSPAVFGRIVMLEVNGGEDGIFSWKTEYDLDCVVMRSAEAEITTDAYLAGQEDVLEKNDMKICMPASAVNGRLTSSASVTLRPESTYVTAWGTAFVDRAQVSGNKMNLSGNVKMSVLTAGGGEFYLDEVTVPMKYTCEADPRAEECECGIGRTAVEVCEITARADGNMLNLTAELFISAVLMSEKNVSAAVSLSPLEESAQNSHNAKNKIRIYVPEENESAWDVEKKFRLGREAVREGGAYVI